MRKLYDDYYRVLGDCSGILDRQPLGTTCPTARRRILIRS